MNKQHKRRGFTLIEILVVLSIIALTISISSFRYWKEERVSLSKEKDRLSFILRDYFYKAYTEKRNYEGKLEKNFLSIIKFSENGQEEKEIYREKFPSYIEAKSSNNSDTFLISCKGYITSFSFFLRDKKGNSLPITITPFGRIEEKKEF